MNHVRWVAAGSLLCAPGCGGSNDGCINASISEVCDKLESNFCDPLAENIEAFAADDYLYFRHGDRHDRFYDPTTADVAGATLGELVGITVTREHYENCRVSVYGEVPPACVEFDGPRSGEPPVSDWQRPRRTS